VVFREYSVLEARDGKNQLVPYRTWLNFAHVIAASEAAGAQENKESPKEKP
jgi:hypothetical protein